MPGIWEHLAVETQRLAWNLVSAYYAASDRTLHDLTDWVRRRELKIAVDLVDAGCTAEEAVAFVAWTQAEPYRPSATSLRKLEDNLAQFRKPTIRPTALTTAFTSVPPSNNVFDVQEPA